MCCTSPAPTLHIGYCHLLPGLLLALLLLFHFFLLVFRGQGWGLVWGHTGKRVGPGLSTAPLLLQPATLVSPLTILFFPPFLGLLLGLRPSSARLPWQ